MPPKKPVSKPKPKAPTKKPKAKNDDDYGAAQITVLEGLAPVRKRPGMYIGNTASEGLHHLLWEVVDNGIDEAMAGHCTDIIVKLLPKGMVSITDNGRGIPIEVHKSTKVSAMSIRSMVPECRASKSMRPSLTKPIVISNSSWE